MAKIAIIGSGAIRSSIAYYPAVSMPPMLSLIEPDQRIGAGRPLC
jgi:hypothetical protein